MNPTPEMIEAAAKAIAFAGRYRNDVSEDATEFWTYTDDVGKACYRKMATAALALLPVEPKLYGPYGYLNGSRALSEEEWTLDNNPGKNSDEYFSIPLFAKVDVFSPTPHPSLDREGLLEEARRVIEQVSILGRLPNARTRSKWMVIPAAVFSAAQSLRAKLSQEKNNAE